LPEESGISNQAPFVNNNEHIFTFPFLIAKINGVRFNLSLALTFHCN